MTSKININPKNDDNLKNEDDPKYEDVLKNETDLKNKADPKSKMNKHKTVILTCNLQSFHETNWFWSCSRLQDQRVMILDFGSDTVVTERSITALVLILVIA